MAPMDQAETKEVTELEYIHHLGARSCVYVCKINIRKGCFFCGYVVVSLDLLHLHRFRFSLF